MLSALQETVPLFVFYHECGHMHVGDSELKADCWVTEPGVREAWLDKKGIGQVCQSFDGMPETDTHPSAQRRCRNIDQCFSEALSRLHPAGPSPVAAEAPRRSTDAEWTNTDTGFEHSTR